MITGIGYEQLVEEATPCGLPAGACPCARRVRPRGRRLSSGCTASPRAVDEDRLHDALILSLEPTLDEDVSYGVRLLVDIAERSLAESPFQDPTTAVQAIDRLHDILRQLARRPFPDGRHLDETGQVRLIVRTMSWEAYVHLAFDEIRLAGAGSPQVTRRLKAALSRSQVDRASRTSRDHRSPARSTLDGHGGIHQRRARRRARASRGSRRNWRRGQFDRRYCALLSPPIEGPRRG